MANNNKQTGQKSTEEVNYKMRRSFSWDRAFYTSDGFLADEELSSMIEGGVDDIKHESHKIEELDSLETKLLQEIEASTQKATEKSNLTNLSINTSLGNKGLSQAKKVSGTGGSNKDAPTKTPSTRSSSLFGRSGSSPGNNVKTPVKRSMSSKSGKGNSDSPSKTPPAITPKNKLALANTRVSRTSPASPRSPGSSPSAFAVTQRSKRSGSVPNKLSAINEGRIDDRKASKPAVNVSPNTQSIVGLKIKPPPVISHPFSPSSPTTQRGIKGSPVKSNNNSLQKQAAKTGSKPNSPKTKKQSSPKAKASLENIFIISPEILDLKGKIKALKMEIDMHKDRCNKIARAGRDELSMIACK